LWHHCRPVRVGYQHAAIGPMPLCLMVAISVADPEMGLQSRWYRQHRNPCAPDRLEPNEPRRSPRSNVVEAQVHLVQRRADLHDRLKLSGI
jgi:hypothetical protein